MKNYLYLAEQAGAAVLPLTTVDRGPAGGRAAATWSRPRRTGRRCAGPRGRSRPTRSSSPPARSAPSGCCTRMRATGQLPGLSARVGALTRTNSEAIARRLGAGRAARRRGLDFTEGVAITSSFHPDARTHIEPVRYGKGSNVMGLLQTVLTAAGRGGALALAGRRCSATR